MFHRDDRESTGWLGAGCEVSQEDQAAWSRASQLSPLAERQGGFGQGGFGQGGQHQNFRMAQLLQPVTEPDLCVLQPVLT